MTTLDAIILGLVQGLTEFIPVSSSGHLLIFQNFLLGEIDHLFIQALDFGTLAALLIYFRFKLKDLFLQVTQRRDYRLARNILITSIPAGFLGLLLADFIQTNLYILSPYMTIAMLAIVGILMILSDNLPQKTPQHSGSDLSPRRSLFIGLAQSLALIPGVSRSGSTILASRVMGLNPKAAAEYSFMVSIPIMLGLVGKLLLKPADRQYLIDNAGVLLIANVTAFIAALFAIHFLLNYLSKHGLAIFGYYRIALATVVLYLLLLQ